MDCDHCEKKAVRNYQKAWMSFPVSKQGDYGRMRWSETERDIEEPTGDDNIHLCAEHEGKFLAGEL